MLIARKDEEIQDRSNVERRAGERKDSLILDREPRQIDKKAESNVDLPGS